MGSKERRNESHAGTARRALLAQEAARLVFENGYPSIQAARQKVARAHGLLDDAALPGVAAIEDELRTLQRLFGGSEHPDTLRRLRGEAAEAMQALADFQPRLCGPVLDGTAEAGSAIELQVFSDEPEALLHFLAERGIPAEIRSRRMRFGPRDRRECPVIAFANDRAGFRLTVIPLDLRHQLPLGEDGLPTGRRAGLPELQRLLATASADGPGGSRPGQR